MIASGVRRKLRFQWWFVLAICLAGCQTHPGVVRPRFGLETMTLLGTFKFDQGTNAILGQVMIRYERPGAFELVSTTGPAEIFCHVLSDHNRWNVEFPSQNRTVSGEGPPGDEQIALWVESQRMIEQAIQRAAFADEFTQTMRGDYDKGRFTIELGDFRRVVGEVLATRMRLTCRGCKSSLEIVIHDVK